MTIPTEPRTVREAVGRILSAVEKPWRYIGGEAGQTVKESVQARMALVFPDLYELGMSNNALRTLYHIVNLDPRWAAERAYAPWPDMGRALQDAQIPLYSLETFRPLCDFEVVGITLQTELNYTNVPYVLDLSHIPVWAADRGEEHPIVVGGGPCMSNPEPVAPFFDAFVIGDGEILTRSIMELATRRAAGELDRAGMLRQLAGLPGMYVPSAIEFEMGPQGDLVPVGITGNGPYDRAKGVKRTWVEILDPKDAAIRVPAPNGEIVHERFAVELLRGCTQGCRFCQAGYWYRPIRELAPDAILEIAKEGLAATGSDELGLLSLSTADYSQIAPLTDRLVDDPAFRNVNLSLPSLRANMFGQTLARKVARARGGRSATFAPETGSERLRKVINKTITDDDMIGAAEGVFSNGWHTIKLYTMIGLPTETMDDMEAFSGLIERLGRVGAKHTRRAEIHPNVGILVPKPFTPMQWVPFVGEDEARERIQFVRERFRRNKHVRITWSTWEISYLEAVMARGDRQLAPMILEACRRGYLFESNEHSFAGLAAWREIFAEHGYDSDHRVFRERGLDEVFPWDFIHAGVTKGFLKEEYRKMYQPQSPEVPDCRWGACNHCGVPGNYQDIQLAPPEEGQVTLPPPGTYAGKAKAGPAAGLPPEAEGRNRLDPLAMARAGISGVADEAGASAAPAGAAEAVSEPGGSPAEMKDAAEFPETPPPSKKRDKRHPEGWTDQERAERGEPWTLVFAKTGLARFLGHHGTMTLIEKALRRAGVKLFLSRGFNPKPRIRNAGALPVGMSSQSETLVVELESAPAPEGLETRITAALPAGLSIVSFQASPSYEIPIPSTIRYALVDAEGVDAYEVARRFHAGEFGDVDDGRGRIMRTQEETVSFAVEDGIMVLEARVNPSGNSVSPFVLWAGATGLELAQVRTREIAKL
ncbi:MAG: TIGR03960 family B12-binding radical SAM protein [Fibrobacteria bacterium]|nr:TIGR03960 family B12-binding radical SAM protein [Fibrobacteria bacterium]